MLLFSTFSATHHLFIPLFTFFFLLTSPLPHAPRLDCPHVSPFFLLWFVFPLLFYLVAFNSSFVQDLVITPGSVRLTAVGGLCWPDAGLLSQAAGRGTVLCLPECAHCHHLQHAPSILYFPVRDLHPSVIPLSSVPKTEDFWREGGDVGGGGWRPGTKLPLWQWLTGKSLYADLMISEARERAADKQSDLEQERKLGWLKENRRDHILKSELKWEV